MANFNLLEIKRSLGEPITSENYENQIKRLEMLNNMLLNENSRLREENAQKHNKLTNWLKNLIN